jgi:hypothetical protein
MTVILVKTGPQMQGHIAVEAEPAAVPLVKARPDVWWWCLPFDGDDGWYRGGAWDVPSAGYDGAPAAEVTREVPLPPVTQETEDEDDADDRW